MLSRIIILLLLAAAFTVQGQNILMEKFDRPNKDLKRAGWSFHGGESEIRLTPDGLEIDNTGSKQRRFITFDIPYVKGKIYTAEVMIRAETVNIQDNSQRGATIFTGFLDKDKKWVPGGTFPHGIMGSSDWRKITVPLVMPVLPEVRYMQVWVGIEGAGKAWFKDLVFKELSLERNYTVDTAVNPPVFKFNIPASFIGSVQNVATLELRRKDSNDYFIFFLDGNEFAVPHSLAPGEWEAVYSFSSSGGIFANIRKSFTLATDPTAGTHTAIAAFPNGAYRESPELEVQFYPELPVETEVAVEIDGQQVSVIERDTRKVRFRPAEKLKPGSYQVKLTAGKKEHDFLYNNRQVKHEITFRDDKLMMVDGKPFFPVGTYRDPSDQVMTFDGVKKVGFNMTHSYYFEEKAPNAKGAAQYLAACRENGVMSFLGISRPAIFNKDFDAIRRFCAELSGSDAAFVWYLIDEPVWQKVNPYYVREYYRTIKKIVPQIPVVQLHTPVVKGDRLIEFYGQEGDIFWHDTYPVPKLPLNLVYQEAATAREIAPSQAVWSVIQAFDMDQKGALKKKQEDVEPKAGKIRCMTHLALAGGSRGIIFYWLPKDRYDMQQHSPIQWAEVCATVKELNELMPFLTGHDVKLRLSLPREVKYWAKSDGSRTALAIINSEEKPIGASISVSGFRRSIALKPYEVQVHIIDNK